MSDSRFNNPIPPSADEYKSRLKRGIEAQATFHHTTIELVSAMPARATLFFQAVDRQSKALRTSVSVAFKCPTRAEACELLGHMPPIRLTRALFDANDRATDLTQIWPVTFEPIGYKVKQRTDVAPFLYSVSQGANYGPIHELMWVTKLAQHTVCIQTRIETSEARFLLEKRTFTPPGRLAQHRFKWERDRSTFPEGPSFGRWGAWANDLPGDAKCTVYWPMNMLGFASIAEGEAQVNVGQLPPSEMARILLDPIRSAEQGVVGHE